jgi:hypothetical protein
MIRRIYQLTTEYIHSLEYVLLTNNKEQDKQELAQALLLNNGTNEKPHHNYLLN